MGVVNDFTDEKYAFVGEFGVSLIGVFYGTVDTVTESEFVGEPEGYRSVGIGVVVGPDLFDETAVIVLGEDVGDLAF